MIIILLLVFLIILLIWIAGFLFVTDFSVPVITHRRFRRVLVIFPHADDETITCGGSLHRFASEGSNVTLVLLTRGEKGTSDVMDEARQSLKEVRTKEAQAVAAILGISRLVQEDFGDGELHEKKAELRTFLDTLIEREKPDLMITYDLSGLYGHRDHITCTEIITELQRDRFQAVSLWYVTLPRRILARVRPPEDLATDPYYREKQVAPTHKLFIGRSVFPKIRAWYIYESQRASLTKATGKLLPTWFLLSMVLFEYFASVKQMKTEK